MKTPFSLYRPKLSSLAVLGALVLNATTATSATFISSKVNGDDQFKIYLSTTQPGAAAVQPEGFQYANGLGWPFTFTSTLYLPQSSSGANFHDYWLNIWVRDEGGGGPDVLGEFTLTAAPGAGSPSYGSIAGCTFDNGSTAIVTNTTLWRVTKPLPTSAHPAAPAGYPTWLSNYRPPWVPPTLTPTSLGFNGVGPWGPRSGISASAQWLTTAPGYPTNNLKEAWFSTHIRCP